jgi:hypothetical protein
MKIFVHTIGKILFVDCDPTDTFQDIKERIIMLSNVAGSKIMYCGKEVQYDKQLKEYNILHTVRFQFIHNPH